MEVDKSMTTRKEDAESIIGEKLAEDIDKEAKLVGKSEVLVERREMKCPEGMDQEECRKWKKEHEDDGDGDKPQGSDRGGKPHDEGQDGGGRNTIVAAPTSRPSKSEAEEDCDCNDPKNAEVEKCKGKKQKSEVDLSEALSKLDEIKSMLQPKSATVELPQHILDAAISKLKSDFDEAINVSNLTVDEKLKMVQPTFEQLGEVIKEKVSLSSIPVQETQQNVTQTDQPDIIQALSEVMKPVVQQLGLMSAQLSELKRVPTPQTVETPQRRSFTPQLVQQKSMIVKSETPNLRAIIERTTN